MPVALRNAMDEPCTEVSGDDIRHLQPSFRQKQDMSLDLWVNEVRLASSVLIANGHAISEREKTMLFWQGFICEDLQSALILPSRTETF